MTDVTRFLGKFEILRPLGRGGMGSVALARDTLLGRDVALKTLLPDLSQHPDALRRFRQEAKAVARLQHPNLVTLFEFGEVDEVCYLAMEFVDGQDLERLLASRAIEPRQLGAVLAMVLDGLEEAHGKQVLHRDVKPSNIRVFSDRGRLAAKLLDFGLAKLSLEEAISHSSTLVGTPYYMAPELLQGGQPDAMGDLWAVAVIFLQGLLGHRPFEASTPAGICFKIVFETAGAALGQLEGAQQPFRPFLEKALAKEPGARFQTAGAMAQALRSLLSLAFEGLPAPPWLDLPVTGDAEDPPSESPTLAMAMPRPPSLSRSAFPTLTMPRGPQGPPATPSAMVLEAEHLCRQASPQAYLEARDWLRKAAALGHAQAQARLGAMLSEAEDLALQAEGLACLKAAAAQDHAEAYGRLVAMAFPGHPELSQDAELPVWIERAAQAGHAEAVLMQARRHREEGLIVEAIQLLEQAWELGLAEAALECGLLHQDAGRLPEAKDWLAKASWRHHPGATVALAKVVLQEGAPTAAAYAAQLLREPAGDGDPEALFLRGSLLLAQARAAHQTSDAWQLITQAARLGFPAACLALAREQLATAGPSPEALALLRQAADAGQVEAGFELGMLMLQGKAGANHPRLARELILQAAQAGVPEAMHAQWELLVKSGQPPREPTALAWLQGACDQGHVPSLHQLGQLMAEGTPAERMQAVGLLRQAAEAGHRQAAASLQRMHKRGDCTAEDLGNLAPAPSHGFGQVFSRLKDQLFG